MKIPFNVYDFFGYLTCGFFLLCAIEYATGGQWLLNALTISKAQGLFLTGVAYIIGQLIASLAYYLFEEKWLRQSLGPIEEALWGKHINAFWKRFFPKYYDAYTESFRNSVVQKATGKVDVTKYRELFKHCHAVVVKDKEAQGRLLIYLTQYGFARNMACAFLLTGVLLLAYFVLEGNPAGEMRQWWALGVILVSIALLFRYVKFYVLYTRSVFETFNAS